MRKMVSEKVYTLTLPNGYKIILETWRGRVGERVGYITVEKNGKVVLEAGIVRERKRRTTVYRVYVYKGRREIPIGEVKVKKDAIKKVLNYLFG